jgi:hypothetical protein
MTFQRINKKNQERAKAFFHSQKWKNILVFFSFVVLAFCFRINQYFKQNFDFEVAIPIHYTHIPSGVAFSSELPQEIILKAQDKGTAWLHYSLDKEEISITIDLNDISLEKSVYVVDQSTLHNLIRDQLLSSTNVNSFSPGKIEIDYSPLAKKELPVVIDGTLLPAPGYMFSEGIIIEPAVVTAFSDKKTLDTLYIIQTSSLDKKNINKTMDFLVRLKASQGVQLSNEQVKVSIQVEEYTEKKLELPVICYNLPKNRIVRFFPSSVELSVQVGLSKYTQVTASDFEISLDYKELSGNNTSNCLLKLAKKPAWLNNYRIVPEAVEYLVEQKNE